MILNKLNRGDAEDADEFYYAFEIFYIFSDHSERPRFLSKKQTLNMLYSPLRALRVSAVQKTILSVTKIEIGVIDYG